VRPHKLMSDIVAQVTFSVDPTRRWSSYGRYGRTGSSARRANFREPPFYEGECTREKERAGGALRPGPGSASADR
jgi:hypothetical protein